MPKTRKRVGIIFNCINMKKTSLLISVFFVALSPCVFGQGWVANSATNTLNGINSSLGLTPLKVGLGTSAPSTQLHTTEGVRFAGLINDDAVTRIIGSDVNGNLFWRNASSLLNTAWQTNGNLGTNPAMNYVGTRDAQPLVFKTNGIEQMRITTSDPLTNIGVVEVGGATANGNLSIWGRDITGYSHPVHISCDITGANFDSSMSPLPGSGTPTHTMGRMLRLNQVNGAVTTNAYDMGIDMNGNMYITDKTLAGARLQKRAIVVANNNVGINFGMATTATPAPDPTANFHTIGTVRHEGLDTRNGTMLVIDPAGNVFNSGIPVNGTAGVTSTCNTINRVPVVSNASGDLSCSQIFDNSVSVGINKTGGFTYNSASMPPFTAGAPATQNVRLDVNGLTRSISFVATSDAKFKKDITPLKESLENIMKLKPVEYNWRTQEYRNMGFDHLKHTGFIAQELAGILPNSVIKDEEGNYAVDYSSVIPVLTQAIQQQQAVINDKSNKIADLENRLTKLEAKATGVTEQGNRIPGAELYQNAPNPFGSITTIGYKLPASYNTAQLLIFDMNGKQMRDVPLQGSGAAEIAFQANELAPGMYLYSLVVDGTEIDTKRMILSGN
jgi:hypothetical protein